MCLIGISKRIFFVVVMPIVMLKCRQYFHGNSLSRLFSIKIYIFICLTVSSITYKYVIYDYVYITFTTSSSSSNITLCSLFCNFITSNKRKSKIIYVISHIPTLQRILCYIYLWIIFLEIAIFSSMLFTKQIWYDIREKTLSSTIYIYTSKHNEEQKKCFIFCEKKTTIHRLSNNNIENSEIPRSIIHIVCKIFLGTKT